MGARHNLIPMNGVMEPETYSSAREDRDYLLEYKSVDLRSLRRESVLDVPVDNVTRDEAVALLLDLIEKKKGPHAVMFMDPVKLSAIRPGMKNHWIAEQARVILPDGAGMLWASRMLRHPLKERIPMIAFLMDIVRLSMKKEFTIYLLGSKVDTVEKAFHNLNKSFPGVRIIGRHGGHFDAERGELVRQALRKSSPDVIFLGMGFPTQEKWNRDNIDFLSRSVVVFVDGAFDVLSGNERKAPDWAQVRGLAWFWRTITRPYRVLRFLRMIRFYVSVVFRNLKMRNSG
jgi:N-acetylglucosaminyldiphosphoundecaprenol N-acetyl-beta-D-mannosaminyltransferase